MMLMPDIDPEVDHVAGSVKADILLVEYGDFECSYCGAAYFEIKQLQQVMGPRLSLIFRHFPLTQMHPHALRAAEFAEAAAIMGRFWEMHDILFENQATLDERSLVGFARMVDMSQELIAGALSNRFEPAIRRDIHGGVRSGVNGTPSLFINGERFDGPARSSVLVKEFAHRGLRRS
jgi:protein-disulfide isomerase